MFFKQLFEPHTSSFTYLVGCRETGEAALVDPVLETVDRDLSVVREHGFCLKFSIETHIHADHITGGLKLKALSDCLLVGAAEDKVACRDLCIAEGDVIRVGVLELFPLFTPGHTATDHCYLVRGGSQGFLLSGDVLLIDGCGRTDFQSGDPARLFDSVQNKIFNLPGDTIICPGHDYQNRFVTTVAQERLTNSRLKDGVQQEDFVRMMNMFDFPSPRRMYYAVNANLQCGKCPDNVPEKMKHLCEIHDQG